MQAAIYGLAGTEVSAEERDFFRDARPAGYILFRRNIETRQQLRALTDAIRDLEGHDEVPILIDQEGGRVARMRPPEWPAFPTGEAFDQPGASDIVGDRALGSEPMQVAALGKAILDGLASAGALGVIKHIPGHGRALVDSHHELPVVEAGR
jgi:beta-N-acetylhexosaminidase